MSAWDEILAAFAAQVETLPTSALILMLDGKQLVGLSQFDYDNMDPATWLSSDVYQERVAALLHVICQVIDRRIPVPS